jgi:archaellum biogenesis ATPase FlaH
VTWAEDAHDAQSQPARLASSARFVNVGHVAPERISWLWPGFIPAGKLTLIDGDPGDGKSTMTLDLTARISSGTAMPDGTTIPLGRIMLLSAEDGIADTIRPRLDAAGADVTAIVVFDEVFEDGTARPVELPRDLHHIERAIRNHGITLVVIDPLMAFLGGVDSHNDQSVRRALHPISKLADATGCAIVVVRHLNKGGGKAIYRGGGSIGIAGAARAVHLVAPDPDDPDRRILAPVKVNIAKKSPAIIYRLVDDPVHGCARVQWEGTSSYNADDLVNIEAPEDREDRVTAEDFLATFLAGGPRRTKDVEDEAEQAHGISVRSLKRARKQLGVIAEQVNVTKGRNEWWLSLPGQKTTPGCQSATRGEWPPGTLPRSPAHDGRHLTPVPDRPGQ